MKTIFEILGVLLIVLIIGLVIYRTQRGKGSLRQLPGQVNAEADKIKKRF